MVPKLNLKLSVLSVFLVVIACEKEKFKGPIGVNQSTAIPVELRNLFESNISKNYVWLNRDRHPVHHTVGLAQFSVHYRSVSV